MMSWGNDTIAEWLVQQNQVQEKQDQNALTASRLGGAHSLDENAALIYKFGTMSP